MGLKSKAIQSGGGGKKNEKERGEKISPILDFGSWVQ